MNATPMRFQQGDTLSIRDDKGQVALWLVIERKRGGYLLRPQSGSDARTWSDDEIDIIYGARRLTHHPCNADGLPKAIAETLEKTWEYKSLMISRVVFCLNSQVFLHNLTKCLCCLILFTLLHNLITHICIRSRNCCSNIYNWISFCR